MKLPILAAACTLALVPLAGCGSVFEDKNDAKADSANALTVTSTSDKCEISGSEAKSGTVSFDVKNDGSEVTEFYLYAEDGLRIVGEVENIGPGGTKQLVVTAQPGNYVTSCKPGMVGDGIRSDFTVTDSGEKLEVKGVDAAEINKALDLYAGYVKDQASELVTINKEFLDAYTSGDDNLARALYAPSRTPWERIETVAEAFGDLDPAMDLREADVPAGDKWTGWHRIEKDLWPPAKYTPSTQAQREAYAKDLFDNIELLNKRAANPTACDKIERVSVVCTVDQISNGSKGLLDEVATGKISGEEDIWSHTDLWDFQANVDGAKVGYETLKSLLQVKDPALAATIGTRFTELQVLLDEYRDGDGFAFYDTVALPQRNELSAAVNALAEPLSQMTGSITK